MKKRKVVPIILLLAAAMLFMTTPAAVQALELGDEFIFWFDLNPKAGGPKWFGTENVHWSPWSHDGTTELPRGNCDSSVNPADCPPGQEECCAYNYAAAESSNSTITIDDFRTVFGANELSEWVFFVRIGAATKKLFGFSDVAFVDWLDCTPYGTATPEEFVQRYACELYKKVGVTAASGIIPLDVGERTFQENMMINYFKDVVLPGVNRCGQPPDPQSAVPWCVEAIDGVPTVSADCLEECPAFDPQMKSVTRGVVKFDPPSFMMIDFEITERP